MWLDGVHFGVRRGWAEAQLHHPAGCATLGKEPDLSEPPFLIRLGGGQHQRQMVVEMRTVYLRPSPGIVSHLFQIPLPLACHQHPIFNLNTGSVILGEGRPSSSSGSERNQVTARRERQATAQWVSSGDSSPQDAQSILANNEGRQVGQLANGP